MAKVAVITDTHFGVRQDSPVFHYHQKKFYDEIFFPYLDKHNIKHVLHGGDLTDRQVLIKYSTLELMNDTFMSKLKDRGIETHAIIGNHDCYYRNTNKLNSIKELYSDLDYPGLHIYWDSPDEIEIDGTKILMVPWINRENYQASIDAITNTSARIVLGHFDIKGFQMYKGHVSTKGLSPSIFDKFRLVMSGHYHLKSSDGPIHYLGAPYEMNWNDYGDTKGFHILDTETGKLDYIQNPDTIHVKILYDDDGMSPEDLDDMDLTQFDKKYIRLVVENKTDPYLFDLFSTKLSNSNAESVNIIENDFEIKSFDEDEKVDVENTPTIIKKYVKSYAESAEIADTEQGLLGDCILDIYKEAMTE